MAVELEDILNPLIKDEPKQLIWFMLELRRRKSTRLILEIAFEKVSGLLVELEVTMGNMLIANIILKAAVNGQSIA